MNDKASNMLLHLKWNAYRTLQLLGLTGMIAVAVLVTVVVVHQVMVIPTIHAQDRQLTMQIARIKEIQHRQASVTPQIISAMAGPQEVLDLIRRHGMLAGEVKYQRLQMGKERDVRIVMRLPTEGRYPQFRDAMVQLTLLPGVRMENFRLLRKKSSEQKLAIDMTLSITHETTLTER